MRSQSLRIDARFTGAGGETHERYLLRRTHGGFRLESEAEEVDLPELVIPSPVMELFLETLSESPLLKRSYEPAPAVFRDYPATTLDLRTDSEEVIFFSRPEGDRHLPWRVEAGGTVYLVPDDSPQRGLEILDPFLERDPHSRAMKLLTPHVGEERALSYWEKLDGPLEAEEALRVVRRLKDLLARNVEDGEILQAIDEYVARVSPPEPTAPSETVKVSGEALFSAARSGDAEAIRARVALGDAPDARGPDGKTALMIAAERGGAGAVRALLDSGAAPDVQTLRGDTALALAARNRHLEVVKLLLSAGASPKRKDGHGTTPLMETTDAGVARVLIRAGAEVNAADERGLTPMMRLIAAGGATAAARAETLQSLLTAGGDVRARDREGRTALIWAVKGTPSSPSHPELVQLLIAAGAELEARDREGGTALVYAAVRGDTESARLLIEAGADVNARMGNLSAIDIALRSGRSEIVTLLIRAGARR
jgi:ankyrin repeat protein